MKSVQIRSFFWSECGKIRTRKISFFEHSSHSVLPLQPNRPAPVQGLLISANSLDAKVITRFCLSHYIDLHNTSVKPEIFGKTTFRGNSVTLLYLKDSFFHKVGGWRGRTLPHIFDKYWPMRGRRLKPWKNNQKLLFHLIDSVVVFKLA